MEIPKFHLRNNACLLFLVAILLRLFDLVSVGHEQRYLETTYAKEFCSHHFKLVINHTGAHKLYA